MQKGKFLHPVIYKFAKLKKKEFLLKKNKNLNIRSSFYLKKFINCIFKIHNGKDFVINDPIALKAVFKIYPRYNFKIGQFSYNRHIFIRGRRLRGLSLLFDDIKKKRGLSIKLKKKKRLIFTQIK